MNKKINFPALSPRQSASMDVICFVANSNQISEIAKIERAGRSSSGALSGFQRPQISTHIHNIADYLEKDEAILPNALVLGFLASDCKLVKSKTGAISFDIDVSKGAPGWVVDGQQRFTALQRVGRTDFEVIVTAFISPSAVELHRQFILINSARPLPKALVYELLPSVPNLPEAMRARSAAAQITEALNFGPTSSLKGLIKQQTNPKGVIADTILQKVIMSSMSDGALRLFVSDPKRLVEEGAPLISEFFYAVQQVFRSDWEGHTPKTSRLLHGTGIVAMGFVMEQLHASSGATDRKEFALGLKALLGQTAWTSGEWAFAGETRSWNSLQNVPRDMRLLSMHLVQIIKRAGRTRGRNV